MICKVFTLVVFATGLILANPASALDEVTGADEVAQALLDARESAAPPQQLEAQLASGGKAAIPGLFEVLVRGRFDVFVGERGHSTRSVLPSEHEALVSAFRRLPWPSVRTFLGGALEADPDHATQLVALKVLGGSGTKHDFPALLDWSQPTGGSRAVGRAVRQGFGEALGKIIDREFVPSYQLTSFYSSAHLSLVPSILTVLGARPSPEHVATLSELLGLVPEADVLVLVELGQQGKLVPHPIDEGAREHVREYLGRSDPNVLVAGIVTAEQMEDVGAVHALVELLNHPDPNVRQKSLAALKSITGQQLGRDPQDWRDWYASARRWWETRAPGLIRQVTDPRASVASRAVLELSKHRFYRHELAPSVARGLECSEPEVMILTCATLGHLGSPLSVPVLIERLADSDLEVKRAALLALRRITGTDLGEEPQGWIDAGW